MAILLDAIQKAIIFVLHDDSVPDAHNTRIMTGRSNADGVDIEKRFRANPIALWMHDRRVSIGRWVNVRKVGSRIIANLDLSDHSFAKHIGDEIRKGYLKGASIGFREEIYSNNPKLRLPGQQHNTVVYCVLYEASIVLLPSNAKAITEQFAEYIEKNALQEEEETKIGFKPAGLITRSFTPVQRSNNNNTNHITIMNEIQFLIQAYNLNLDVSNTTLDQAWQAVTEQTGQTREQITASLQQQLGSLLNTRDTPPQAPTPEGTTGAGEGENTQAPANTPTANEVNLLLMVGNQNGFLTPENRENYRVIASGSQTGFEQVQNLIMQHRAAPPQQPGQPQSGQPGNNAAGSPTSLAELLATINANNPGKNTTLNQDEQSISFHELTKKDPGKLKDLRAKNPAAFDKLCRDEFGMSGSEFNIMMRIAPDEPAKLLFAKDVADVIYPNNTWYMGNAQKDNNDQIVETKGGGIKVIRAQAADDVEIVENPSDGDLPLTAKRSKEEITEYPIDVLASKLTIIRFDEDIVFAYEKRKLVQKKHMGKIATHQSQKLMHNWSPTNADWYVRTTGADKPSDTPNGSGTRKSVTRDDIVNQLTLLDNADIPEDGRQLVYPTSFKSDILKIDDFIHADKSSKDTIKSGAVGELFGAEVHFSKTSTYTNGATPGLQDIATYTSTSNWAGLAFHPDFVCYVEDILQVFMQLKRGEYLGSLFNIARRFGGAPVYKDRRGISALIQGQ